MTLTRCPAACGPPHTGPLVIPGPVLCIIFSLALQDQMFGCTFRDTARQSAQKEDKGLWRGAGERFFLGSGQSQLLKTTQQQLHFIDWPWALHHTAKCHPDHVRQPTDWHHMQHPVDWRPMDAAALLSNTLMLAHLDRAQWDASPPPPRLAVATATPLRRPPHPLQVRRGSSAPLLFMRRGTAKRV